MELMSITMYENSQYNYGISDVWGYTDEYGNEYAIVGYLNGTKILDVSTNPEIPVEVMDIPGPSDNDYYYHRDYKTLGDVLYTVCEMTGGDMGMQVIDLSPLPENPPIQYPTYNNIGTSKCSIFFNFIFSLTLSLILDKKYFFLFLSPSFVSCGIFILPGIKLLPSLRAYIII